MRRKRKREMKKERERSRKNMKKKPLRSFRTEFRLQNSLNEKLH